MNILILSPGYPAEMPQFTRGLAEVGARVYGVGDQGPGALPELVQRHLSGYLPVRSLWDEQAVVDAVRGWPESQRLDAVECLWEPGMLLAARLREALNLPGLTVAETVPFRDKEAMKQVLDRAGIRTPRHLRCNTIGACWEAAERIGYPIIIKPIAGAGSADTYRVDSADDLRNILPRLEHVPEVSVEEFVDGDEFTFDTVTIRGEVAYHNVAWYRPRPLVARSHEWISPQVIALRNQPFVEAARSLGAGHASLIFRHLIPNAFGPIIVYTTLTIPEVMMTEAFLSFLGLGTQEPLSSWGLLASTGAETMDLYPWQLFFPALMLFLTIFALNLVGEQIQKRIDGRAGAA